MPNDIKPAASKAADVSRFDDSRAQTAELLDISLDLSDTQLLDLGVFEFNRAAISLARSGWCFLELKARLEHGEYTSKLLERGIAPERAREAARVAMLLSSLPKDQFDRVSKLPKSKAIELAKADPQVIEDLLESGADDVEALSVRELRARINRADKAAVNANLDKRRLEVENNELKQRLANRVGSEPFPEPIAIAREESAVYDSHIDLALDALERVADNHIIDLLGKSDNNPDWHRSRRVAAGTLYHSLRGTLSRASHLLDRLTQEFGDDLAGEEELHLYKLTAQEIAVFKERRAFILEHAEMEARNRKVRRENAKPGKRGRKRKVEGEE